MEGDNRPTTLGTGTPAPQRRLLAAWDVVRFILGFAFIVLGAGLLLEGVLASLSGTRLFLSDVNRVFEFYVGLMSVALGGLMVAGMSKAARQGD